MQVKAPGQFLAGCGQLGLAVSAPAQTALARYAQRLLEAGRRLNLTAARDAETIWTRHLLDSMTVVPFLGDARTVIDVGAGAGLPGLVVAIQCPERVATLLEATGKKCQFLCGVVRDLALDNVRIVNERAETAGRQAAFREQFDVAVARAVARLPTLLELVSPFVRPGGAMLALKGEQAEQEIAASANACDLLGLTREDVARPLPDRFPTACVVRYRKHRPTPPRYPRRNGIPAKRPL